MLKTKKTASSDSALNLKMRSGAQSAKKDTRYRKLVPRIQKRDGSVVSFDFNKIFLAIYKGMLAVGEGSEEEAMMVAHKVMANIVRVAKKYKNFVPTVEGIQDEVERELILSEYVPTAKHYILYRQNRAALREARGVTVSDDVRALFDESKKHLRNNVLSEFVFYTSYARWNEEQGRRETWVEAVDRFMDFMQENIEKKLTAKEYDDVRSAMICQDVCPSMRLLWSAGPAARNSNVCAYNCAFIAPTKPRDFGEIMYISMCGTGLGFSSESEFVEQLPQIKRQTGKRIKTHVIPDSKEGWADALVLGLETWFAGKDVDFDYAKLRPAGARLKTMGGRSSGPEPLRGILDFVRKKVLARQGKRLRPIDVHDIVCKIGEGVVAGGVRRSALISLSDLDDTELRDAKKGQFYLTEPQRSLANNSAVYTERPTAEAFLDEWTSLVKSQTGERGIFNAAGFDKQLPKRRLQYLTNKYGDRSSLFPLRTNPCGEIYLQSKQFCNLSSIVIRPNDTLKTLERKMELATLLGTYQSTLTNFGYLSPEWKKNCEDERLLGVSLTGYYDNPLVRDEKILKHLRDLSRRVNRKYSKRFKTNDSTCITCVKPHGNSSQLLDTASGMHPRFSPYYIRRVRVSRTDPVFQMLKDHGVPYHPEVGQSEEEAYTFVLEFPVKSPAKSIVRNSVSALEMLKEWERLKRSFTEHNPSATIYVGPDEWIQVSNFLYENFDYIGGLTFLPRNDHVYKLAPYEEITKDEYERRLERIKGIDFSKLVTYEQEDNTQGAKELACAGGTCEI